MGYSELKEIREKANNNMIDKIKAIAKEALNATDYCGTWHYNLCHNAGNVWAICFAYMDYDNTGDFKLYGKIAYQPDNSIMQCDYDIDWIYPLTDNGDCYDVETTISKDNIDFEIMWLLDNWNEMKKYFIEN